MEGSQTQKKGTKSSVWEGRDMETMAHSDSNCLKEMPYGDYVPLHF